MKKNLTSNQTNTFLASSLCTCYYGPFENFPTSIKLPHVPLKAWFTSLATSRKFTVFWLNQNRCSYTVGPNCQIAVKYLLSSFLTAGRTTDRTIWEACLITGHQLETKKVETINNSMKTVELTVAGSKTSLLCWETTGKKSKLSAIQKGCR